MADQQLFTIGHSNHTPEAFLDLLRLHGISAVGDVRSSPYSRFSPHFNQAGLKPALEPAGIAYLFWGAELGARPGDPALYESGRISYERLAASGKFRDGLARVRQTMMCFRVALMCAEKDPIDCHRMILLCRHLRSPGLSICHVLADGSTETNEEAEWRLRERLNLPPNLFHSEIELIEQAYDLQGRRIAFAAEEVEAL